MRLLCCAITDHPLGRRAEWLDARPVDKMCFATKNRNDVARKTATFTRAVASDVFDCRCAWLFDADSYSGIV
jgi:hypothetical protein